MAAASRAPKVFSSAAGGAFLGDPRSRADLEQKRQLLVSMDAPEHTAVRRVVSAAMPQRAVRAMAQSVGHHVERVVDAVVAAGEFDAVADLAAELPLLVLADLLGVPRADRALLFSWSNNLVGFDDPEYGGGDVRAFIQTVGEAFSYATELAAARRREPRDDLVSALVGGAHGAPLTESQFCHLWLLMVVAGNETTRHLLSGTLELLADRPNLAHGLASDPSSVGTAMDEMLRWVTPIMQFRRTATIDTSIDDQAVAAGDKIVLYYLSANRDERVFDRPDTVDLRRVPNPHLAFGVGPHYCIGAQLAKIEATALFTALLPHLTRLERAGPTARLESNFMNGIKALPLRLAAPR